MGKYYLALTLPPMLMWVATVRAGTHGDDELTTKISAAVPGTPNLLVSSGAEDLGVKSESPVAVVQEIPAEKPNRKLGALGVIMALGVLLILRFALGKRI